MYENVRICHDRLLPREQALMQPQQTVSLGPGPDAGGIIVLREDVDQRIDTARPVHGRQPCPAGPRQGAGRCGGRSTRTLTFDFNNAPDAEIRIAFDSSDGAWSYIGTDCQGIPRNQPTMNLGFLDGGTAAHEFGHAIGLAHEHQNPEGRNRVERRGRPARPEPGRPTTGRPTRNPAQRPRQVRPRSDPGDGSSIPTRSCSTSSPAAGSGAAKAPKPMTSCRPWRRPLSPVQAMPIRASACRAGRTRPSMRGTHAGVDRPAGRGRPVHLHGAEQGGRHVIETGGQTDVVMKLFGPDQSRPTADRRGRRRRRRTECADRQNP
jgi:hypothetical protein